VERENALFWVAKLNGTHSTRLPLVSISHYYSARSDRAPSRSRDISIKLLVIGRLAVALASIGKVAVEREKGGMQPKIWFIHIHYQNPQPPQGLGVSFKGTCPVYNRQLLQQASWV
jgi:hypothetical protein